MQALPGNILSLLFCFLASSVFAANVPLRILIIGKVTDTTARIVIEADSTHPDAVALINKKDIMQLQEQGSQGRISADPSPFGDRDQRVSQGRAAVFAFSALNPSTRYNILLSGVDASGLYQDDNFQPGFTTYPRQEDMILRKRPLDVVAVSCNNGRIIRSLNESDNLWNNLWARVGSPNEEDRPDLLIHMGDQVYMDDLRWDLTRLSGGGPPDDYINSVCAFCKAENLLMSMNESQWGMRETVILDALFRDVYHNTWSVPATAKILASIPSLAVTDDHEYRDGWGDNEKSFDIPWNSPMEFFIGSIAYNVALEYQQQLYVDIDFRAGTPVLPPFHNHILGDVGLMFLDMRVVKTFFRQINDPLPFLGSRQWKMIGDALKTGGLYDNITTLLIVCPEPMVYLSPHINDMGERIEFTKDAIGMWPNYPFEQRKMLDALRLWKAGRPNREVVIIAGDVHISLNTMIYYEGDRVFIQTTTSSIGQDQVTHAQIAAVRVALSDDKVDGEYLAWHFNINETRNYGWLHLEHHNESDRPVVFIELKHVNSTDFLVTNTTDGLRRSRSHHRLRLILGLAIGIGGGLLVLCCFACICYFLYCKVDKHVVEGPGQH